MSLVLLLACSCEHESKNQTPGPESARPAPSKPVPSKPTPSPAPETQVTPWSPRNEAAQFFARPADSWTEQDLLLADYTLDVRIATGVATATLDVSITNPAAAQAEAVIDLPIPPGAAVTDAILWVGDKPMVGVMLASGKAREVYDEIVGRRRDPLLVAWKAEDMLSLSIFPLESKQTRRFKITWVEPSVGKRQWVPSFYHRGKEIGFPSMIKVASEPAKRDGSWVKTPATLPASGGDWRLIRQATMSPTSVAVVIDTSGALAAKRGPQWRELEAFVDKFEGRAKVTLIAADWLIAKLGSGRKLDDFVAAKERFMAIRSAGLFDQKQALATAGQFAGKTGAIAVLSTAYPFTAPQAKASSAAVYWVNPNSSALGSGAVGQSGGRAVPDGATLATAIHPMIEPAETGFHWLPMTAATGHVVWLGSRKGTTPLAGKKPGAVEALFYKAMLRRAEIPPNKIVSPHSSILVLESEKHYKKYGIKDAKGEIARDNAPSPTPITALLKAGKSDTGYGFGLEGIGPDGGGIGWATIGTGRFGTIGHGSGMGSGSGMGAGVSSGYGGGIGTGPGYSTGQGGTGARRSSVPRIRVGRAEVRGDLDKNIIRRIIRRHLARIRYCYEKQLLVDDTLGGTVIADFVIDTKGSTANVSVSMDHEGGKSTSACIKNTVRKMKFPKPRNGGLVKVRYPFKLSPGPASLWAKARKILDKDGAGLVSELGALFGYQGTDDRIALAWWLAENHLRSYATPPSGYIGVARLLRSGDSDKSGNNDNDARRILSEGAQRHPQVIADVFKKWGFAADAERAITTSGPGLGGAGGTGTLYGK